MTPSSTRPLRPRGAHAKVTNIELFFDLVFVFAVTQLSHHLLAHLDVHGAVETALLFLAVWWVWICTSWVTNWLDPDRASVRLMLFALMLAGLVLSASLPHAFEQHAPVFACAYVAMQVGRSLFTLWAIGDSSVTNRRNFQRIVSWNVLSGCVWLAGAWAAPEARLAIWAVAVVLEYLSATTGFWVPGLGRSTTTDWDVVGEHLAERCSLFIIIALGESILVTGATAAGQPLTVDTVSGFVAAFVGTAAMWWVYFNVGVEQGAHTIGHSTDPGRIARLSYTYIHLLIVAGIIVCAVADELVLVHPHGHVHADALGAIVGGPALFLLGNLLFKRTTWGRWPLSHLGGLAALVALAVASGTLSPLALGWGTSLVVVGVAVWETRSRRDALR